MWVLPSDATAAFSARRHVEHACSALSDETVEIARLLVTELVTNAAVHGRGPVVLTITVEDAHVRADVYDSSPVQPTLRDGRALRAAGLDVVEHGRGLRIVAALSGSWGVDAPSGGRPGKHVWFTVG